MNDDAPGRARRRTVLRSMAVGVAAGLAGCSGSETPTPDSGVVTPTATSAPADPSSPSTGSPSPSAATPGRVTVPDDGSGTVRERVQRVGTAVREAVVALTRGRRNARAAGWFVEGDVIATASYPLVGTDGDWTAYTTDGRRLSPTVIDTTGDPGGAGDDVAALRTDEAGATLPAGSSGDLRAEQVLVQVGHHTMLGEWIIQYGRVREWIDGGDRFTSTVPVPTPGAPAVTLDGEVVGMTVGSRQTDPPSTERPPPTDPPTVHTDEDEWSDAVHEPVEDVQEYLTEWTG